MGTTHQHIYNFRLDLDVDGENNSLVAMDPVVKPNTAGGPRTSTMQVNQYNIGNEQDAAQKFDVKEYQKSGRGYYGYSEKIKRGA